MGVKMSCPFFERLVAIVILTGANRSEISILPGGVWWGGGGNDKIVKFYKKADG